jgi:hypothetical protein
MRLEPRTAVAKFVTAVARSKTTLAAIVRNNIEARERRIEHDEKFYRELGAYCRANNLPPVCEDDWRLGSARQDDHDVLGRRLKNHRSFA